MRRQFNILLLMVAAFAACVWLPAQAIDGVLGASRLGRAVSESLHLVRWYAREHVLLCLVPAFLIAGAIASFVNQGSILKYFGPRAHKGMAYSVAAVSGTVLAVCSCTVLPLFAGIYHMGAGIGPATTFLYAGPAINVLAIILTARVLGFELGIARAAGAILFSVAIGLAMHALFRKEKREQAAPAAVPGASDKPLWKTASFIGLLVAILVFANWARSGDMRAVFLCCPNGLTTIEVEGRVVERTETELRMVDTRGQQHVMDAALLQGLEERNPNTVQDHVFRVRWLVVAILVLGVGLAAKRWFSEAELRSWLSESWSLAKQILPLLLLGVLLAGLFLGRSGREALIPTRWVNQAVGGNGLLANLLASAFGALMYFATLTEVPILQTLLGSGMGKGPALALLLAGPALSLPNMLVIRSVIGTKKTLVFVALVIVIATLSGVIFGAM